MNKLEAINTLLDIIDESPLSTLQDVGNVDVSRAKAMLDNVTSMVQSKGYNFNTEVMMLNPNIDGQIKLPSNILRVDSTNKLNEVVARGGLLYIKGVGYTFTAPIQVEVILKLDFDDMPEAAKQYVAIVAARKFQIRVLGSDSVQRFTAEEELEAKTILEEQETDNGDYNMLNAPDLLHYRRVP